MYLDPGFGGMLIQILLVLIASFGAFAFSARKKIKSFFNKNKNENIQKDISFKETNDDDNIIDPLKDTDEGQQN